MKLDVVHGALRQLVLRERHLALGARMAPFAGWEMPLRYEGIVAEHEAVRGDVGVFDVSHLARAWVEGPGAGAALRSVTTFDVTSLAAGEAHYSLYCTEEGGIADDVFVYRVADERWLVVHNAANAAEDFARLEAVAGGAAREVTAGTVMLAVQGPRACSVLGEVLGAGFDALELRQCAELAWGGTTVLVARTGYTGEDGGECIVDAERAGALWDALLDAGARPCGLGARDTLRLEAALPLHGSDIDETTHPFEAGLGFAVSLEDGAPFTGRGALVELKEAPRTRRLACVQSLDRAVLHAGYELRDAEGETVGTLASGAYGPSLRLGIGMAYLPIALAKAGTALTVDVRGRSVPAQVVRRPFYRRPAEAGPRADKGGSP